MEIFQAISVLLIYLFLYYIFGDIAVRLLKIKFHPASIKLLIGYFSYFGIFQIPAQICKMKLYDLSLLSTIWVIVVGAVFLLWLVMRIMLKERPCIRRLDKWEWICIVLVLLQIIFVEGNQYYGSVWDVTYYIGDVLLSVETNTISQYDPYTRKQLKYLHAVYLFENYGTHSMVTCQLTGMKPIVEMRTVLTAVNLIIYNTIIYHIGILLLGKRKKDIFLFMSGVFLINLFMAYPLTVSSGFLFIRAFEGKTILGNIIIPSILFVYIMMIKEKFSGDMWRLLFWIICCFFTLNMSSIFIVPIVLSSYFIPASIVYKNWKVLRNYFICLIPCVLAASFYMLCNKGIIQVFTGG